jgi:hypothetical protein
LILARTRGLPPRWETRQFALKERSAKLLPVVSGRDIPEIVVIDQDAAIYVSELRTGKETFHKN